MTDNNNNNEVTENEENNVVKLNGEELSQEEVNKIQYMEICRELLDEIKGKDPVILTVIGITKDEQVFLLDSMKSPQNAAYMLGQGNKLVYG